MERQKRWDEQWKDVEVCDFIYCLSPVYVLDLHRSKYICIKLEWLSLGVKQKVRDIDTIFVRINKIKNPSAVEPLDKHAVIRLNDLVLCDDVLSK